MSTKKSKLVIISTLKGFSWGGSEELWYHTALVAKDHFNVTVCMLSGNDEQSQIKNLRKNHIKVIFIAKEVYEREPITTRVVNKITRKQPRIAIVNRFTWIEDIHPDFVLVNASSAISLSLFPDLKDWLTNTNCIFDTLIHHHTEAGLLPNYYNEGLTQILLRARNNFIVAQRNIEVLERQMAIKVPNVKLVQNPVNINVPQLVPYPNAAKLQIAVVARLDCNCKGQDILLETLSADRWNTYDFHVNLYGSGPDEAHLKNLIQYYQLEDRVELKGHVNSIEVIWNTNHILMLPSLSEGTPISLVEAMCCGRGAIVTDVGDNARLVQDGITGFVTPVASVMALTQVLERALSERDNWQKMGETALELAKATVNNDPGKTLIQLLQA